MKTYICLDGTWKRLDLWPGDRVVVPGGYWRMSGTGHLDFIALYDKSEAR